MSSVPLLPGRLLVPWSLRGCGCVWMKWELLGVFGDCVVGRGQAPCVPVVTFWGMNELSPSHEPNPDPGSGGMGAVPVHSIPGAAVAPGPLRSPCPRGLRVAAPPSRVAAARANATGLRRPRLQRRETEPELRPGGRAGRRRLYREAGPGGWYPRALRCCPRPPAAPGPGGVSLKTRRIR